MRLHLLAGLFILPFLLPAQANDTKAKNILDELIRKSRTYQTIKAEFTYKLENKKNKVNDSYQGSVMIKGNRYRLSVAGQTVIYSNNTVWTYIKSANEVQINSTEENEDAITPTNIFDGSYLKNFKPKYISEGPVRGKTVHIIDMTPLQGKSYFKVRLEIEKSSSQIVSFAVYDKNGSIYTYIINKFQTNMNLNDDNFVFRPSDFPGAEINDMR